MKMMKIRMMNNQHHKRNHKVEIKANLNKVENHKIKESLKDKDRIIKTSLKININKTDQIKVNTTIKDKIKTNSKEVIMEAIKVVTMGVTKVENTTTLINITMAVIKISIKVVILIINMVENLSRNIDQCYLIVYLNLILSLFITNE